MTLDPKKDKKGTYGYLLTGLAFCCPLNCISSNTCWLLGSCISGGLTRLLGCGMMVAPTCLWPCIPDSATFFIVIFYKYFFKFLGVAENKYMAPSEEAAKAYAKEIEDGAVHPLHRSDGDAFRVVCVTQLRGGSGEGPPVGTDDVCM